MNLTLLAFGYRRIGADAHSGTQLLNLCMEQSVSYTDFCCDDGGNISFRIQSRAAKRLLRLCRERGVAVRDYGGGGLPHFLWRCRRRFGMLIGLLIAAFLVWLSGQFVWDVRVSGQVTLTEEEVRQTLRESGFGVGSYIPDFCGDVLETRVMMRSDRIAWISVYMDGTVAIVQIREYEAPPEREPTRPANLVAACDGEIELLELYRGDSVVKIGQTVRRGELLVSGVYDSSTVGYRYTRAAGRVLARVEEVITVEIPLQVEDKVYLESKICGAWLDFFDFSVKIFKNSGNWEGSCDIIEEVKEAALPGFVRLPFGLTVQKALFYRLEMQTRTPQQALELAYARLEEELSARSELIQLLQKNVSAEITDTSVVLTCEIVCVRDIAQQVEFEVVS